MNPYNHIVPMRKEELFRVPAAQSTLNRFADHIIPQNPWMAPNDFGSPHQDSWCSESVSLNGPVSDNLLLIEQYNPFGYTPNMVCNSHNQMIGVSLDYTSSQFWVVVFDENCNIISATPAGELSNNTFSGGYFYLDDKNNTIVVQDNQIVSYPTENVQPREGEIYPLMPNWQSSNIVELVTQSAEGNTLYSSLPVWDENRPNLYWCLISGEYNYQNYPNSTLTSPAWMAVVQIDPINGNTELIDAMKLEKQWNNNTFAVDEKGAYIVTNGIDNKNASTKGYLWAFGLEDNAITIRWKTPYKNAGYMKPGQKNIGSGTTPTLTKMENGTELVAITDNDDPRLNVLVCNREDGSIISETPCFLEKRSADEASLIGVGDTFVVENNFGHYPTWPFSQLVPNAPGMEMIRIDQTKITQPDEKVWTVPDVHFYAMNMLCRGSGIIFAHTCNWSDDISASKGGMYYVSALDSFDGRVIWQIPLGRGVNYCHEYGGIYFNKNGDLYIGTNQYLVAIKSYQDRAKPLKEQRA
ncbi:hypothetical protein Xmau_02976 [Xenorhabdus mauleonii]|uniref:PQQ-like domain-containing protein n=1 Tax=Xenorhabdus mauleonii TaxID=351675 RepID=A0A1I3T5J0_9GAMM|nr:hypothetical protein [Xenorhabdus mauleonii]PHM39369.1 hypothetical protein Xmau_02976 [Xenorhabdus mauleonii]SFJ66235.1 hypothetical protein SAMN05421680_1137 [Xenorhabdus mauleonii]